MHIPLLQDILIVLCFSVVIVFALQRLKLPSIIGFLATGVIIGPHGLSLIKAIHEVEIMAEIGVILLLFVIGMEFSLKQLAKIRKTVFVGGLLQVGMTIIVVGVTYFLLGFPWNEAVFVGFLFSLSSTAIVLKTLQDNNEISTPHGRNALAILIFQDIIVVPMMLLTPLLGGQSGDLWLSVGVLVLKSLIVIVLTFVSARFIFPRLLHSIARTNSKELFLLVTMAICFAIAYITSEAGLSLALGAFLAGLVISESDYSHQATSIILPFRELFTSFFFVSIGMLLDLEFFTSNIAMVSLLVLLVFVVKAFLAALAIAMLNYPPRTVILTGLSLFQVGEFAFILSNVGLEYQLLNDMVYQYFLSISIVSMLLTPFVIQGAEGVSWRFLKFLQRLGWKGTFPQTTNLQHHDDENISNHLIIIGYGINGSNLSRAARAFNIPYIVIELNPDTVRRERKNGIPIIFGDATHDHMLDAVNLHDARAAVIAISDPQATKVIAKNIRSRTDSLYLVVRTRYIVETSELIALGVDEVIPEEFETSVQIFTRVLQNFLVPEDDIDRLIDIIRSDNYELFKHEKKRPKTFRITDTPNFNITCLRVNADSSKALGTPLKELNLRSDYGINIVGIMRDNNLMENINPDEELKQHDILYVQGTSKNIENFHKLVR